ncbi:hypothetical protein OG711_37935 [Streptomyces uncialis]|uniref:hypothetical protein n=1 Tax=Streptomyces uncialis TaxID=1048205 RepID=UPI002E3659D0|nr:hypothetical protein [Streptomyces uncialis]
MRGHLFRAAAESQVLAILRNREPEKAFTEIAAQREILRNQHERAFSSDRLEADERAALAYNCVERVAASTNRLSAAS